MRISLFNLVFALMILTAVIIGIEAFQNIQQYLITTTVQASGLK